MTVGVLAAVVVLLLGFYGWQTREWAKERARLIAAAIARTPLEAQLAVLPPVQQPKRETDRRDPVVAVGDDA